MLSSVAQETAGAKCSRLKQLATVWHMVIDGNSLVVSSDEIHIQVR